MTYVVACAGRRIDAEGLAVADRRFPLTNVINVRRRLEKFFKEEQPSMLVCSAACGADLLALDIANDLNLRCRIILPFKPARFRDTSVIDRPSNPELNADWGTIFDRVITAAEMAGDLVVMSTISAIDDTAAYAAANRSIISEALHISDARPEAHQRPLALIVWDGMARQPNDATAEFRRLTVAAGFIQRELRTN
ncbi:hypothetical protein HN018_25925 (plasmid) [Lichenicola cladoniae]|uniref:Uncharacterized protein n=1 Tax=Lichenicola cladoniae TaxID=1484109 RepID=A0A6M8HZM1_9PROT|nr:hypothetical protein [Lichenicola cladoniae]NPD70178.1 hypothetical protein [Acetobacteraceae bacterium]QKE93605.1 hypothetical protein HN018_25925 [Lichenicola cladoniae]